MVPCGMDPRRFVHTMTMSAVNFCKGCGSHWHPPEPSSGRCGHCKEQVLWISIPPFSKLKIVPPNKGPPTPAELGRWNVKAEVWTPEAHWPEAHWPDGHWPDTCDAGGSSEARSSLDVLPQPNVPPEPESEEQTKLAKIVAIWNLGPYTEDALRHDLMEIDFEPSKVVQCGEGKGAFGLSFSIPYLAEAMVVALHCLPEPEEIFKSSWMRERAKEREERAKAHEDRPHDPQLQPRIALWKGFGNLDQDPDIPDYMHEILAEQKEWPEENQLDNREAYNSTKCPVETAPSGKAELRTLWHI